MASSTTLAKALRIALHDHSKGSIAGQGFARYIRSLSVTRVQLKEGGVLTPTSLSHTAGEVHNHTNQFTTVYVQYQAIDTSSSDTGEDESPSLDVEPSSP